MHGTEHLRHQFNLFSFSEDDITGFVSQHYNSEVYKFISAAVDLFN
jgi:hypothetical protein